MIGFKDFNLVHGFAIDYMHCVLLGVVKKLMNMWLASNIRMDYRIKNKYLNVLDERIKSIRPTSEITRKPRSIIRERANFKANEFRSMLLYYLRYSLVGLLPIKYIHHFELLSASIYILLKEQISEDEINEAENMLNRFADEFEKYYGKQNVTMNVHLLRHITNAVRNLGPLWAQSVFGFETNNGVLVKSANGTNRLMDEIAGKYITRRTLQIRENKQQKVGSKRIKLTGNGTMIQLTDAEKFIFEENNIKFQSNEKIRAWKRTEYNGKIYTSKRYLETKSIDYFVEFSNDSLGTIEFFFMFDGDLHVLYEKFKIHCENHHLQEVERTSNFAIQKAENIRVKLIFLQIRGRNIVTRIPNHHEKT